MDVVVIPKVVIKPIRNEPRKCLDESFKKMAENKDDKLIIDDGG